MELTQIIQDFLEIVQTPVNSRDERLIADLLKSKLTTLGCEVYEDEAGHTLGGNAGNIIARLPGDKNIPAVLLSAHMDRVQNNGHIKPIIHTDTGIITGDGTTILAADDVAGIVAILDGLRRIQQQNSTHGDIEIVFSVCEEAGVLGSRLLDYSQLTAKIGYVFDSPGRIGRIIRQAPTKAKLKTTVHGLPAHAGNEPEKGINAIKVAGCIIAQMADGRISPQTTGNIGSFTANGSSNIVAPLAEFDSELRSVNKEEFDRTLAAYRSLCQRIALEYNTTVTVDVDMLYQTFFVPDDSPVIAIAQKAMQQLNLTMQLTSGGGGMDANHFNQNAITAIGVAAGYSKNHGISEQVIIEDLKKAGELVAELVKAVAE